MLPSSPNVPEKNILIISQIQLADNCSPKYLSCALAIGTTEAVLMSINYAYLNLGERSIPLTKQELTRGRTDAGLFPAHPTQGHEHRHN